MGVTAVVIELPTNSQSNGFVGTAADERFETAGAAFGGAAGAIEALTDETDRLIDDETDEIALLAVDDDPSAATMPKDAVDESRLLACDAGVDDTGVTCAPITGTICGVEAADDAVGATTTTPIVGAAVVGADDTVAFDDDVTVAVVIAAAAVVAIVVAVVVDVFDTGAMTAGAAETCAADVEDALLFEEDVTALVIGVPDDVDVVALVDVVVEASDDAPVAALTGERKGT